MREHRIELSHNGEWRRCESAWTAHCECGWSESAHTKAETMREVRHHRKTVRQRLRENAVKNTNNETGA